MKSIINLVGYELKLVEAQDGPHKGKWFLLSGDSSAIPLRWHLSSLHVLESHSVSIRGLIPSPIDSHSLCKYRNKGLFPLGYLDEGSSPPRTSDPIEFRLWLGAKMLGKGIEFGPGANPFPVSLHAHTIYADRFSPSTLSQSAYAGQEHSDFVIPDIALDMCDAAVISSSSQDFIIACHVIEHIADPIGAIAECHRILRPGGRLVLVIPSMTRTFDRERPATPLDHLISDYKNYDSSSDYIHYLDWFLNVHKLDLFSAQLSAQRALSAKTDIHKHAWTPDSFQLVVDFIRGKLDLFSSSQLYEEVSEEAIEFYLEAVK